MDHPDQAETDSVGVDDAFEKAEIEDADGGGVADAEDKCSAGANSDQEEIDGDGCLDKGLSVPGS